ncbi:PQQ-dependent sugar dehydrogenase [Erythrobacter sp. SDW2]|uniref:PQQ-dependent sugar dehydrogenase n=1 Tax=Erythrobacter sp. SDW2 TaxID=2907154 RepID=UPI001F36E569|nr:PQQ-dependent sugar dehydrogenase [Erythrobacter sp. SDW2]UIP06397.1 PQQ-dependent sugar dehydrogenase [Erythrobacter sp. SDW2]
MNQTRTNLLALLSLPAIALASCGSTNSGDSGVQSVSYQTSEMGTFERPWAMAFAPGTPVLFITEKAGSMKFVDTSNGVTGDVTGVPAVDYGGQGGFGDVAFLPSEASDVLDRRTIYLSWAEAGEGDTRGAVVGKGTLVCGEVADDCRIEGLTVIWRQTPKVTGRGHYSHKIAISPDGRYLYISSGDRQKLEPAQDLSNTLGTIVRLNLDGTPAEGNPYAERGSPSDQIWSYGHRNVLGLQFAPDGSLWDLEHGPAGGDELNVVERAANYGWPVVSDGDHYNGDKIPDHATRPEFKPAAIGWTPVIAPGDFIFYTGDAFPGWKGDALIAGLSIEALVEVAIDGDKATETARYSFDNRLRDIAQGPDGSVWLIEDGEGGRLLKLSPAR